MLSLLEQSLHHVRGSWHTGRATVASPLDTVLVFDFKSMQSTLESIDARITYDVKHDDDMEAGFSAQASNTDRERKLNDNRLFAQYPLYCEGMQKPLLRGILHLAGALLLPVALLHLVLEANGNATGTLAACIYIFCNAWCYGCSALYHVWNWSLQVEILLQKLDHCGIALLSSGTMVPLCMLLLPPPVGAAFMALSWSCSLWTCYNIFQLRPSYIRQVLVPACIFIFVPFCYYRMNLIEWNCMIGTIIFQVMGMTVFINKFCNFDCNKHVFGYHEIFHLFVCLAGVCVYVCNWSIVRRTCNPYAHVLDVGALLDSLLRGTGETDTQYIDR